MIKKPKKIRKDVDVKDQNQADNQAYRLAFQNYLGNHVCIPKNALPFKDEKVKKPGKAPTTWRERQKQDQAEVQKKEKTDDFTLREILADNDHTLSTKRPGYTL